MSHNSTRVVASQLRPAPAWTDVTANELGVKDDHTDYWPAGTTTPDTGTITYDNPWAGMVSFVRSDGNAGVAIQAGTGVFAATLTASPNFPGLSTYFYEVGMKY